MGTGRWRIELVEEMNRLPMPWRPAIRRQDIQQDPGEIAKAALVTAFGLLARRGTGPMAWAASFRHDPIAFLLDSTSDAVNLWGTDGDLLYQNRAAERLGLGVGRAVETPESLTSGGHPLERRCCRFRCGHAEYLLEIIGKGAG
jgi:hypothetical protein